MRRGLRALAAAGNAAGLILLVLILARRDALFGDSTPSKNLTPRTPQALQTTPPAASRVLLVVIDALRVDQVDQMPHLAALARSGGRGTARVEALVPSTIAGIQALAEGTLPPPASFTEDFGASTAAQGGIFAAVAAAGGSSFAAGPRLWEDLYGPWLAGAVEVETVRGDDARVLQAALGALRRHDLVVAHFGAPDDASHLAGAASPAYAEAVARCDRALGELLRRARSGTAVIVTSDHGVNFRGGHAGPEPEILSVPVVVRGPGLPRGALEDLGDLRQRDLHQLILSPLGLSLTPPEPPHASSAGWPLLGWPLFLAVIGLAAGLAIWSAVAAGREPAWTGFVLDAALWLALGVSLVAPAVAAGLAGLALAGVALACRTGVGQGMRFFLLGAAFAALRLLDAHRSLAVPLPLPSLLALIGTLAIGIGAGVALRRAPGWLQGIGAAAVPVLLARLFLGETASLSTLDVRDAFRLVDGPFGLAGAAAATLLRQSLPFLGVLSGLFGLVGRPAGGSIAGLAASLGGVLAGQAAVAALLLRPETDPIGASLALGLLARLVGETTWLFLGSALFFGISEIRRPGGRSRPLAATPP